MALTSGSASAVGAGGDGSLPQHGMSSHNDASSSSSGSQTQGAITGHTPSISHSPDSESSARNHSESFTPPFTPPDHIRRSDPPLLISDSGTAHEHAHAHASPPLTFSLDIWAYSTQETSVNERMMVKYQLSSNDTEGHSNGEL
ncbi:hypothetical protein F503_01114 [Ophiostoma piceae UAMH 11346]|uniref:Uncharacterized protein n=1 Tax=Ophiostoma piceae (strain UAMH 11346) TaxID=1262450 RepID=S3C8R1_OPHP1|nr:hypothetical protein F503_01114 [Ophiostoma piceae UAMH 11346]